MHNLLSAVSRRSVGLAAGVVLAGGVAGGVLLAPGTAFASVGTTTTIVQSSITLHDNSGSWYINVPFEVAPAGGSIAPDGTVNVYNGATEICANVALAQIGATTTSGGSCNVPVTGNGAVALTALYSGSTTNGFQDSSDTLTYTVSGVTTTSAPVFTADKPATTAGRGSSYSYNFSASGSPAPTYSLSGPSWLQINSATGYVWGTVQGYPGSTFSYTVTASNGVSPAASVSFKVWITRNGHPGGGQSKLSTSLSCSSPVRSGARGTCTLDVTNTGSGQAQSVTGTITLPAQLKADFCGHGWSWGWFNSWGCTISGNTVTETLGTLNPGQSRDVTVTFTAQSTHYLWGWGHQYREWVKVTGSAQSSNGYFWSPGWWGYGNSSNSSAYVQILPPHYWW
jgi:putative Ig domain-containing protein